MMKKIWKSTFALLMALTLLVSLRGRRTTAKSR